MRAKQGIINRLVPLKTAVVGKLYCLRCQHYQKNVGLLTRHKCDLDGNMFLDQIHEDTSNTICMMVRYNHEKKFAIVLIRDYFIRIDEFRQESPYRIWLESCDE